MKKSIAIACLILLFGCHQKKHHYKEKVQCYKTHSVDNDGSDIWLYYYMFWMNNNSQCYYYTSPTPATSLSNVSWQSSNSSPISNIDQKEIEQMPEQQVSTQEMPEDLQTEMESNPEYFGGMTEEEMGDYEGGNESNSDNSSTDGGSDSGGGDSGGGDSGGGDSGGGGGD